MLTQDEENYLAKIDPTKKVSISAFDPEAKETGDLIVKRIKEKLPDAQILFMGATTLEIAGQNDIDIYVLSDSNDFDKYFPILQNLFGKPPERQIKVYEILKSNKELLKEYEELKLKFNGKSFKDYQRAKYEFYHKILDNE